MSQYRKREEELGKRSLKGRNCRDLSSCFEGKCRCSQNISLKRKHWFIYIILDVYTKQNGAPPPPLFLQNKPRRSSDIGKSHHQRRRLQLYSIRVCVYSKNASSCGISVHTQKEKDQRHLAKGRESRPIWSHWSQPDAAVQGSPLQGAQKLKGVWGCLSNNKKCHTDTTGKAHKPLRLDGV